MTEQEKKELVEAIVARLEVRCNDGLCIDPVKHFTHHQKWEECEARMDEWDRNMDFVSGLRESAAQVRSLTVKTVVVTVVSATIGLIWFAIKGGGK